MKKFLGIVLVLCMLMGCVPAMAEIPSVFPYEGEEVTLRVMGWSGYYDFKWDSVFGQWLKETLGNVNIEMEIPADNAETLMELYLSTGEDMPDVVMYRDPEQFLVNDYGARCVNLLDYTEYMPNWNRLRENNLHLSWYDTEDGEAYMMNPVRYDALSEVWYYNNALLEKYGLDVPTTWDEMKECMAVVCEGEENVDGMLYTAWGQSYIASEFGTLFGMAGKGYDTVYFDYDDSTWKYSMIALEDEIRATVEQLADCYAKGYINPDCFTWDSASVNAKVNNGEWLFWHGYIGNGATAANNGLDVGIMAPPHADGVPTYIKADYTSDTTDWIYVVANTSEYKELACAFIDLLLSDEYATAAYWGVEGVTYTVAEDGTRSYTDEVNELRATDIEAAKDKYGLAIDQHYGTVFFSQNSCIADALFITYTDYEKEYANLAADMLTSGEWKTYYAANTPDFDDITREDMDVILTACSTYIGENIADFIYGAKSMDEWDAFIEGLDANGDINWVLETYNSAEHKPLRTLQADRNYVRP